MARKHDHSPALAELEDRLSEHAVEGDAKKIGVVFLEIFRDKRTAKDLEHWLQQLALDLLRHKGSDKGE